MELGSAGHIAAEAQRKLYDRTGEHAIDMRERINEQAWAEPNQMGVFGPAAGGAMAAARSNRPSSATASRGGRREERVRPRSAASSAGGAAALARQRRRADQGTGGLTIDSVDEFDELMHSVDGLLSPEPPSHPSPPPRGTQADVSKTPSGVEARWVTHSYVHRRPALPAEVGNGLEDCTTNLCIPTAADQTQPTRWTQPDQTLWT